VNSEKLELGRTPEAVPSELVVVLVEERIDEMSGGDAVADEVSVTAVLLSVETLSSEVVSSADEEAGTELENSGASDEETGTTTDDEGTGMTDDEGTGTTEDDAGPTEESAALLEGGATLGDGIAEELGAGDWLEDGCEDSLGEGSGVALLDSSITLLGPAVSLLASDVATGEEEGVLLEGGC
jgi:hypothetical protein